jgi:hypothetical protein
MLGREHSPTADRVQVSAGSATCRTCVGVRGWGRAGALLPDLGQLVISYFCWPPPLGCLLPAAWLLALVRFLPPEPLLAAEALIRLLYR